MKRKLYFTLICAVLPFVCSAQVFKIRSAEHTYVEIGYDGDYEKSYNKNVGIIVSFKHNVVYKDAGSRAFFIIEEVSLSEGRVDLTLNTPSKSDAPSLRGFISDVEGLSSWAKHIEELSPHKSRHRSVMSFYPARIELFEDDIYGESGYIYKSLSNYNYQSFRSAARNKAK